ncbi:DUF2306 domain-containing protein [Fibrella forsythiae]|uniref:DUF2306 domain-containing protein n=1 Tax=Fibrella forsythiae TaxID=2817061 RepID=A0ABS3JFJ8_9BACT|nr:DUF2306 domain-containing protein [Fibrella forsythiae]MBO0948776.1 DUF2306 domain-containing protein [Fibrella forsythiae]
MKTLLTLLLITHIATGFTALMVGLIPMFSQKGSRLHNRAGLVYVYCMITVAITALLLCGLQPFKMMRLFLTGIAVFSFYLCFTGWRATKQKKGQAAPLDIALTYGTLVIGAAMVLFGTYLLVLNGLSFMPIVFTFFGVLTGQFAWKDYQKRKQPTLKMDWYFQHFIRMGGSYIATFTAAAVTNVPRLLPANAPEWTHTLVWIAPSIVGGMLIGRTVRYYKQKFASKSAGMAVS